MASGKQQPAGVFACAISAEIRAAMARQRTSGADLARAAGMSPNYVHKRLRDEVSFTLNDLAAICNALGEDVFALVMDARER